MWAICAYTVFGVPRDDKTCFSSNSNVKDTIEMGLLAFVLSLTLVTLNIFQTYSNAINGSMNTPAITLNSFGINATDFALNLTLIDNVSSVCHGGSVRLCTRHQAYVNDTVT